MPSKIPCSTHSKATAHCLAHRLWAVLAPFTLQDKCDHLELSTPHSHILVIQEDSSADVVLLLCLSKVWSPAFHSGQQVSEKPNGISRISLTLTTSYLCVLTYQEQQFWTLLLHIQTQKGRGENDRLYSIVPNFSHQLLLLLCSGNQSVIFSHNHP